MIRRPALLAALDISDRQLSRLKAAGLPFTPIGTRGERYDLDECKAWLRANPECLSSKRPKAATTSASASTIDELTAASRRVHLRAVPS